MQVEDKEINGFLIENFNQHGLEVGKTQGICPLCSSVAIENLRIRKLSALLMIGNVVSVLVIIVINHFNYIHINAKVKLNVTMLNLKLKRLILL
jgi:hypothetical protein